MQSVHTSDLTVRLGRWQWKESSKFPEWSALQKARFWRGEGAERFKEQFCRPKHHIQVVATSAENSQSFKITKENEQEVAVSLYPGTDENISEELGRLDIRAGIWMVKANKALGLQLPVHPLSLIENGTPFMVYGKKAMVERLLMKLRKMFPMKMFLPIVLYIKPKNVPFTTHYRKVDFSAIIIADLGTIHTQVSFFVLWCFGMSPLEVR